MSGVDGKNWNKTSLATAPHPATHGVSRASHSHKSAVDGWGSPTKGQGRNKPLTAAPAPQRPSRDEVSAGPSAEPLERGIGPALASPYRSLGNLVAREPAAPRPSRAPLAPPPEQSAYAGLGSLAVRPPDNRVAINPHPVRVELHSHYNGVSSPLEFVEQLFCWPQPRDNFLAAFRALRDSGKLSGAAKRLFDRARTETQKAEAAEWVLAARQEQPHARRGPFNEPGKPYIAFYSVYFTRGLLKTSDKLPDSGQIVRAMQPLRQNLLDRYGPALRYDRGADLVHDVDTAHRIITDNLARLHALRCPASVTVCTDVPSRGTVTPGAMFTTEVVRDTYAEFCRSHPRTQVSLYLDGQSKRLLLSRAVVNNRVDDGLTECQLEGHLDIPHWAFGTLCQERPSEGVPGSRVRPGIDIRFLMGLKSEALNTNDGDILEPKERQDLEFGLRRGSLVGVDFRGREADFTSQGAAGLRRLHRFLRTMSEEIGKPVVLRVHVGEGDMHGGTFSNRAGRRARDNIDTLLTQLEDMNLDGQKVEIRLGHAAQLSLAQARRVVRLGLPVEVNVGSNLRTGSLTHPNKSPVLKLLLADVLREAGGEKGSLAIHLSTDGGGVMVGSVSHELQRYRDLLLGFFNETHRQGRPSIKLRANDPEELRAVEALLSRVGREQVKASYRPRIRRDPSERSRSRGPSEAGSEASSTRSVHNEDLTPEISAAMVKTQKRVSRWDPPPSVARRRR